MHRGVKFSCHFTLTEITERWYALLYDRSVSRLALAALRNLHPQTVAVVQAKALYTKAEEQLLASISSVRLIARLAMGSGYNILSTDKSTYTGHI